MEGVTAHLFLMQAIKFINEVAEKAIHKCPYEVDIELRNLTLDETKALDIFPEGIYKLSWMSRNKTRHTMWKFNTTLQVKSPVKESMG